jgi:hypothetical protein
MSSEMREDGKLIFCILSKGNLWFYAESARCAFSGATSAEPLGVKANTNSPDAHRGMAGPPLDAFRLSVITALSGATSLSSQHALSDVPAYLPIQLLFPRLGVDVRVCDLEKTSFF